jgi:hypothetical protein
MAQSYGYAVKEHTSTQKAFKNKYSVELTVDISTLFTIEADSKAQAERVIQKIIEAGGINEDGIIKDSRIWEDAEDNIVHQEGLGVRDKSVARSLHHNVSNTAYGNFKYDLKIRLN